MTTDTNTGSAGGNDDDNSIELIYEDAGTGGSADTGATGVTASTSSAPSVEDVTADLRRQLDEQRAATARAEQAARSASGEVAKFRTQAESAQYDAVSRALEAANAAVEKAENDLIAAKEAGDYRAEAKAQIALAKAAQNQQGLESGKARMDSIRNSPEYQRSLQAPADPLEQAISTMSEPSKAWMRAHPDAITNESRRARVYAAHLEALEDHKLAPDTPEYFAYIEKKAGYAPVANVAPAGGQQTTRHANVSAPVGTQARQPTGTAAPTSNRLVMTPKMRAAAKAAGVTEKAWAKAYLQLKAEDPGYSFD